MIQVWLMASSLGFMLIDRQTEAHPDWRTCRHTYFPRYFATYSRSYTPTHANRHTHTQHRQQRNTHTHTQTNKHHLYASAHAAHIMPAKRKHVLFLAMLDFSMSGKTPIGKAEDSGHLCPKPQKPKLP